MIITTTILYILIAAITVVCLTLIICIFHKYENDKTIDCFLCSNISFVNTQNNILTTYINKMFEEVLVLEDDNETTDIEREDTLKNLHIAKLIIKRIQEQIEFINFITIYRNDYQLRDLSKDIIHIMQEENDSYTKDELNQAEEKYKKWKGMFTQIRYITENKNENKDMKNENK